MVAACAYGGGGALTTLVAANAGGRGGYGGSYWTGALNTDYSSGVVMSGNNGNSGSGQSNPYVEGGKPQVVSARTILGTQTVTSGTGGCYNYTTAAGQALIGYTGE